MYTKGQTKSRKMRLFIRSRSSRGASVERQPARDAGANQDGQPVAARFRCPLLADQRSALHARNRVYWLDIRHSSALCASGESLYGVLKLVQAPQSRRLECATGEQRRHSACQEASRAEAGVPVGGGLIEQRAGRGNDVAGNCSDAKEDASEQVDERLPPPDTAMLGQPTLPF